MEEVIILLAIEILFMLLCAFLLYKKLSARFQTGTNILDAIAQTIGKNNYLRPDVFRNFDSFSDFNQCVYVFWLFEEEPELFAA